MRIPTDVELKLTLNGIMMRYY